MSEGSKLNIYSGLDKAIIFSTLFHSLQQISAKTNLNQTNEKIFRWIPCQCIQHIPLVNNWSMPNHDELAHRGRHLRCSF